MCQPKPGPRCASDTRTELTKTTRELHIAHDVTEQAINHRMNTTGQTRNTVLARPNTPLRHILNDYQAARDAHREAQAAYDATPTGQRELKATARLAFIANDYTQGHALTHRLAKAEARNTHDHTLHAIATSHRAAANHLTPTAQQAVTDAHHATTAAHTAWQQTPTATNQPTDNYVYLNGQWVSDPAYHAYTNYLSAQQHEHITHALAVAHLPTTYDHTSVRAGHPNTVTRHDDGTTNAYVHHPTQDGLPHGYLAPVVWEEATDTPAGIRYIDTINNEVIYPAPYDTFGDVPTPLITTPTTTQHNTTLLAG